MLEEASRGVFPAPDGALRVVPTTGGAADALIAFTGSFAPAAGGGVLVLGRGLTNRWEMAYEVDEAARGRGLGRALATAARTLLPPGTPIWAQVAPGNAASLRATLAAGYTPVGAEVLFP